MSTNRLPHYSLPRTVTVAVSCLLHEPCCDADSKIVLLLFGFFLTEFKACPLFLL